MLIYAAFETDEQDHWKGQSETRGILSDFGISYKNATWSSGSASSNGKRLHSYKIRCTNEEATIISLKAYSVSRKAYDDAIAQIKSHEDAIKMLQVNIDQLREEILWSADSDKTCQ